ncbi:hypothetical protein PoB_006370600 [Plakobranchus ocellatus]|uniref:Uncharacterized protein n=1 Tax=Plakobranchus ocellatus TaxID=259542 RepID=A0AAV4CZN9_9GAST|nr:hypothetical protein PoB_006370600 [Plakobranchus ocellatus]
MTPDEKLCTLVFDEMSIKEAVILNSSLLPFKQGMVNSLMVASTRKSCKDDLDIFIFGLQNIASSSTLELATTQTNLYAAFNLQENVPPSLLNMLAYIAGCICHRIAPKLCRTCSQTFDNNRQPPRASFYS